MVLNTHRRIARNTRLWDALRIAWRVVEIRYYSRPSIAAWELGMALLSMSVPESSFLRMSIVGWSMSIIDSAIWYGQIWICSLHWCVGMWFSEAIFLVPEMHYLVTMRSNGHKAVLVLVWGHTLPASFR